MMPHGTYACVRALRISFGRIVAYDEENPLTLTLSPQGRGEGIC